MAKVITTVLGDIAPSELGITSIHEHAFFLAREKGQMLPPNIPAERLSVDLENITYIKSGMLAFLLDDCICMDNEDAAAKELIEFKKLGGNSVLDCTFIGGRVPGHAEKLRRISKESGVNLATSSGYYGCHMHPKNFDPFDKKTIEETIKTELFEGIDGSDIRANVIKQGFCNGKGLEESDLSVYRTLCGIAAETKYPLVVHGPLQRENASTIVDIALNEFGIAPEKFNLCHLDYMYVTETSRFSGYRDFIENQDKVVRDAVDFAKQQLEKGIRINLDHWGSSTTCSPLKYYMNGLGDACYCLDDSLRMQILLKLIDEGFADQIMFGHDNFTILGYYNRGGYGYTRMLSYAVAALKEMGFEKEVEKILIKNPAEFLSHEA